MPLYHGNTKIKDLYIGNTKIGKLYHGSTLVYSTEQETSENILAFLDSNDANKIIRSTDAGATWTTISTSPKKAYKGLFFAKESNTYIATVRSSKDLVISRDGGDTWTTSEFIDIAITEIIYLPTERVYVANTNGNQFMLWYSSDLVNWSSIELDFGVRRIQYLNNQIVIIGYDMSEFKNHIYSTDSLSNAIASNFEISSLNPNVINVNAIVAYYNGKYLVKNSDVLNTATSLSSTAVWTNTVTDSDSSLYGLWYNHIMATSDRLIVFLNNKLQTTTTDFVTSIEYMFDSDYSVYTDSPLAIKKDTIILGGVYGRVYRMPISQIPSSSHLIEVNTPYEQSITNRVIVERII